jgi:hypothetical protein
LIDFWCLTPLSAYKKGCTRLAATSDKVYQLLAHGQWFSLASSTTKTGRHDIAEILLKVVLNTKNQSILVNFITCGCESSATYFVIYKAGREPMHIGDRLV